ncbi:MAG: glycosyltransferase [Bacteroidetes bacterium]|nr:MAG: glycosyltransferase [Bacteroidota bacterium]
MSLIVGLFFFTTFIQLIFWGAIFARLAFYREKSEPLQTDQPVSILICARNEAENLARHLPRILNQNGRSYEVLVISDNSTDDTLKYLTYLQRASPHLRVLDYRRETGNRVGKKFALAKGIESARHEVLLLTDADCAPASENWLNKMRAVLHDAIEIGLGYAPYEIRPGFLNKVIRFETTYAAIQYLSFALAGMPYMGVGRNLIYKKALFRRAGGFKKHENIASGDDDLFVNQVATATNTKIILDPETFVYSEPEKNWRDWFRQKSRHLTTGTKYRLHHQVLLGALSLSHTGHYLLGMLVAYCMDWRLALSGYLVRIIIVTLLYKRILKKLQDPGLWLWIPLMDVLFVLYYLAFAPVLFFGKTKSWK